MVIHPSLDLIAFWVFTGAEMRMGKVCSRGGSVGRCMCEVANLLCLFRACMYTPTHWHLSMKEWCLQILQKVNIWPRLHNRWIALYSADK